MNVAADAPFVSRPAPMFAAGALALGVHVLFVLLLVFGVSWQTQHPAPVMVDLWEALPKQVPAVPPPKPRPESVKVPEPVKAAPAPKPVVKEPPPIKAPDIALEKKKAEAERLKKQQAVQQAEEKARAEAARKAREKQLAEQKKRELLRQMEEEDLMRRMADEDAANVARQAQLAEARAAASKRQAEVNRIAEQNSDLISAKVNGNTRLPDNLKSNIVVRFHVKLLPTGEVVDARVARSSGNVDFDRAVERAIYKSSPLPLPADRDARAKFVPEFDLIHRP